MRHKKIGILIAIILIMAFASGCNNSRNNSPANAQAINGSSKVDKIEIYHFHATQQCVSCKTVGAYAEETINLFFSEELKSGKIVFGHINVDLPENAELVKKYGVTGSSLWIGVYDSSGFHKEENVNVWYKINNKDDYLGYLKGIINKRLDGNYSQ